MLTEKHLLLPYTLYNIHNNIMNIDIYRETKQRTIKLETFTKAVLGQVGFQRSHKVNKKVINLIFTKFIRKYRYDILNSYDCYKVITDGYHTIKQVEFEDGSTLSCKQIISNLEELFKMLKISEITIVETTSTSIEL